MRAAAGIRPGVVAPGESGAGGTGSDAVCNCDPCPYKVELSKIDDLYLSFCS